MTIVYVKASPSASVPVSVIAFGASSSVVTLWPFATGALLTGFTVIFTVAGAESTVPSFTLKVKLSAP
ncbi:hypothetical protein D1872_334440 [compost metagenome]